MEINAATTGANAAAALIGGLASDSGTVTPTTLTADQQAAVQTAVATLLTQAGIADTDSIEVHLAASPDGGWAVLRVARVLKAE